MSADLTNPVFQDPVAARRYLERVRWAAGVYCPHCGVAGEATKLKGEAHREGVWKCKACRKQFTVTVGTVFERSKIPLHKWLLAAYLLCGSKKGVSSHQLHRMLGVTYKTAWFMSHRLREAMKDGSFSPMGGEGKHVEADETFIGKKRERRRKVDGKGVLHIERGTDHKHAVMTLVERGGRARSVHVDKLNKETIYKTILTNIDRKSRLQTDEARHYWKLGKQFEGGHGQVTHSKDEYVRGADHTNTVEGFFSIFKRGMKGIYQHCGEQHLQRYLNEFDFRYNNRKVSDWERTGEALRGADGKRLMYRAGAAA